MGERDRNPAVLVLENGAVFRGASFGAPLDLIGEVCFNTSMSGYQEILTDPSYAGQIITMTYPMIGNYGINEEQNESARIHALGLVVREYVPHPSNFSSQMSLGDFLRRHDRPGLERVDTRRLVLLLRSQGAMRGGIFMGEYSPELLERVRASPRMEGADWASQVSTKSVYAYGTHAGKKYRIACLDFGIKTSILRLLDRAGFAVDVLPARTTVAELNNRDYHCYFLSNGPGDPEPLDYATATIQGLLAGGKPIFGICLGHQLIGRALGRSTYKLKFGHRGGNQPVKNFATGRVEITAQNHGFAVSGDQDAGNVSHINLNDRTIEGFADLKHNLLSVQYHPEASPGPHDSAYLFGDFYRMVDQFYGGDRRAL